VGTNDDRGHEMTYDLTLVHLFDAPRELVFRQWIDPAELSTWFASDICTVTFCELEVRPGGRWRVEYRCEGGSAYAEYGEFDEVVAPEGLAFTLTQEDHHGNVGPVTHVTVRFADVDGRTEMTFTQTGFNTAAQRDSHIEGWNECFRKLERHMASVPGRRGAPDSSISTEPDAEGEIRTLIERWANAVQNQDLETIVSHHTSDLLMFDVPPPTELRGTGAYRDSWTPFFDHFKNGGVFAIDRLDVVAGPKRRRHHGRASAYLIHVDGPNQALGRRVQPPMEGSMTTYLIGRRLKSAGPAVSGIA
jgi:uncharacterized protein YndB with AHSA1/START domain/ketosteroid isomerase-like protein